MVTREYGRRAPSGGLGARVGRIALVAIAALVETAALGVWLSLVQRTPTASVGTVAGFAVLAGGLVVGYSVTNVAVNGFGASFPGPRATAVSIGETGLWALWLLVADRIGGLTGIAVAGGAFALLLVVQHTVADNVLRGEGLLATLVDPNALGFSLVQAGGATLWLLFALRGEYVRHLLTDAERAFGSGLPIDVAGLDPALVGLVVLAMALFVERFVAVGFSRHG